ncbi:MAG: response regulator [Synergistaceae bacterium]|nr:response regulator [Synergistaceae bacterium]
MADILSALDVFRAFCDKWFVERDAEGACSFLLPDCIFRGTGINERVRGKAAMCDYIKTDIAEFSEAFTLEFYDMFENSPVDGLTSVTTLCLFTNSDYKWRLSISCTLVRLDEGWKISAFHAAEPAVSQRGDEHYPTSLVLENIAKQRRELFDSSVPGGMMGGYIEPHFPFYFINDRMLEYLGYSSEAEFIDDIDGLVSNCMHPDDRKFVDDAVGEQLSAGDEYVVEYRMRKKDGSYIFVHDIGRRITAEDGRKAIISSCIDVTAQHIAQEKILNLYNSIMGGVFICGDRFPWTVTEANDGFYSQLGYTREEFNMERRTVASIIHQDDIRMVSESIEDQVHRRNGSFSLIHRVICKDGSLKWISVKGRRSAYEEDKPILHVVFVDVTAQMELQRHMREHYEREVKYASELAGSRLLSKTFGNVSRKVVEMCEVSPGFPKTQAGDAFPAAIEKFAGSAVDPRQADEIRSMFDCEKLTADYEKDISFYTIDFLRRRVNGEAVWCSTNARTYRNPENGELMIFMYSFDVTDRRINEQILQSCFKTGCDFILDVDLKKDRYRVLSSSGGREDFQFGGGLFSKDISAYVERCVAEEYRELCMDNYSLEKMKELLREKTSCSFQISTRDKNGESRAKKIQIYFIDDTLGRVCVMQSDVTDILRREQEQNETLASALTAAEQANTAKSDFLSRMSHEIRTPMNAIIGMATIAAQSIGNDDQVADCISKIGISSRFLLSLINDILDMSRIESGKMLLKSERIPTAEFLNGINSICYAQAEARGVDFECIVDPVLDDYYIGDPMKLQQVLVNILSNAVKFTGEGGKVTFSATQRLKTKSDVVLRFVINDTGIGMSDEFLPHIFEPFSQENSGSTAVYGGTGLGLSISKSIVDMMDGKISVRSIKGIGSEFTVDVKLGLSEEEKERRVKKKQIYNFSSLKALVVDDDVVVCENTVATLKEIGLTAEWVDSGKKAIARVRELWDKNNHFDMILIDWKMPDMDGIETARRIRGIVGPDVTIIIITAYDWISIEHEAKLAGVNMMVSKPLFKSSLVSAFNKALGEKETEKNESPSEYDFSGKRVLVAEDHPLNTEIAVLLLEQKGFSVETAENGLRAMELFSKSPEGYYDAILMDIRMPLMDGLTACSNIRHLSNKDAKTIPIIAMTANAFDEDIEKSKAMGMNAHLAKPIEPKRLYQTLYDFIFGGGNETQ